MRRSRLGVLAVVLVAMSVVAASLVARPVSAPAAAPTSANPPDVVVASAANTCAATPSSDPPIWEQDLPIERVSPGLKATDPGCVTEVGRTATSVAWHSPDGHLTTRTYDGAVNYFDLKKSAGLGARDRSRDGG
jgi:Flp pilus assembly protein CpaB